MSDAVQQRRECRYFIGLAVHDTLGEDHALSVIERGQQVHSPPAADTRPTHGLTVDRDRPPPLVSAVAGDGARSEPARHGPVQQVRIDRLQHPADRAEIAMRTRCTLL